jgi:hypothetical protein
LAQKGQPVDWMFAFKFNAQSFPGCTEDGATPPVGSKGIFGGSVNGYPHGHSQQYVFATNANPALVKGTGCLGATPSLEDPLAATFAQVYNTPGYFYVLWNDQFYNNPIEIQGAPMGHSKGMVVWNADGEGFVLQVSTPSWPASGSRLYPRQKDGNTLGCINDDDVMVSQHFFAVKTSKDDLVAVLKSLANSSVVTDIKQPSIVQNGGPADVQALVKVLGQKSRSTQVLVSTLSSGITLISKPSSLQVPVWQMISAQLKGCNLRVASWWEHPVIDSTPAGQIPGCWRQDLGTPGAVEIATSGQWQGTTLGLLGGAEKSCNHAKVGVSTDASRPLSIFGDMNQQGTLSPQGKGGCALSQNGRGGLFYVVNDSTLWSSITSLLKGSSAGSGAAPKSPQSGKQTNAKDSSKPVKNATKKAAKKTERPLPKNAVKTASKKVLKPARKKVAKPVAKTAAKRSAKKSASAASKKRSKPAAKKASCATKKPRKAAVKKSPAKKKSRVAQKTARKASQPRRQSRSR